MNEKTQQNSCNSCLSYIRKNNQSGVCSKYKKIVNINDLCLNVEEIESELIESPEIFPKTQKIKKITISNGVKSFEYY